MAKKTEQLKVEKVLEQKGLQSVSIDTTPEGKVEKPEVEKVVEIKDPQMGSINTPEDKKPEKAATSSFTLRNVVGVVGAGVCAAAMVAVLCAIPPAVNTMVVANTTTAMASSWLPSFAVENIAINAGIAAASQAQSYCYAAGLLAVPASAAAGRKLGAMAVDCGRKAKNYASSVLLSRGSEEMHR